MSSRPDARWIDAGPETDFEVGVGRKIDADGTPVAVFRDADGHYVALADQCPHAGAPLSSGVLRDGRVVCCWHGWSFEPATGRCTNVPWARPVGVHGVRLAEGRVLIESAPSEPAAGSDGA